MCPRRLRDGRELHTHNDTERVESLQRKQRFRAFANLFQCKGLAECVQLTLSSRIILAPQLFGSDRVPYIVTVVLVHDIQNP